MNVVFKKDCHVGWGGGVRGEGTEGRDARVERHSLTASLPCA